MNTDYQINRKENVYFTIMLIISIGIYFLLITSIAGMFGSTEPAAAVPFLVLLFYAFLILSILFLKLALTIGHLKGNAIKVSSFQFPEIHQMVTNHSRRLGLQTVPDLYILQSGGMLNAFASRFMAHNYIIINSDVVEASEKDKFMLSFIIGHELGHIQRNHMLKKLFLLPSWIFPFLGLAYSRACEYTCDSIGHYLSPFGADNGLLLMAAGKNLYKKVNIKEYTAQQFSESGFWTWFAEKASTHPNLTKRLACFADLTVKPPVEELIPEPVLIQEKKETDYSRYMPK